MKKISRTKLILMHIFRRKNIPIVLNGMREAYHSYKEANSSLWVSTLCYYAILSTAPMLAIAFAIMNWLGVGDWAIERLLARSPINAQVFATMAEPARRFLDNTRGSLLAGFGFVFLAWSLIKMFTAVERAFNDIWQIQKVRHFVRRITDYFAIVLLTPVFLLVINGVSSYVGRYLGYMALAYLIRFLPYILMLLFFSMLYMVMPNTRVYFVPAFLSAFVVMLCCMLFQTFFYYLQGIINTYNKIYGSFAILFIYLFLMRVMWFFIILGCHLTYFLQHHMKAYEE